VTGTRSLTDPRAIGWPLLVILVTVLVIDQAVALGSFGQAADGPSGRMASALGVRLAGGAVGVAAMFTALLLARVLWLVVTVTLATLVGASAPARVAALTGGTPRPVSPDEVFLEVSRRYQLAYETIVGEEFRTQSTSIEAEKRKVLLFLSERQDDA